METPQKPIVRIGTELAIAGVRVTVSAIYSDCVMIRLHDGGEIMVDFSDIEEAIAG
jgi:hypothetical protein